jgi:succinate dehydrogenase / fumarate reductase membrane anchor subunit
MKFSFQRTSLAKARGWGSAHEGTQHFLWQRLTAIALIPLCLWFVWSILHLATGANQVELIRWLSSGINAAMVVLMLLAMFYHAKLGLQVIIEDYVHCPALKITSLFANIFLMYGLAAISMLAVIKLHLVTLPPMTQ